MPLDQERGWPGASTIGEVVDSSEDSPRPQFKIIHFMIFAAFLAAALALFRESPTMLVVGGLFLAFMVVQALLIAREPSSNPLAHLPADLKQRIAFLEDALARGRVVAPAETMRARYRLLDLYQAHRRYEEAIAEGRRILKMRVVPTAIRSDTHLRISNCLEALGHTAESQAEWLEAVSYLDRLPRDTDGWFVRGKLFEKQRRYGEAVEAFENTLRSNLFGNTSGRDNTLMKLILATFHAGRAEETLKWAERAISVGVSTTNLYIANRMAGTAAMSLDRYVEAERHHRRAHERAVQARDTKKVAECLASLGEVRYRLGELDRAEAFCREAESLLPEEARHALLVHSHILRTRGRFPEALDRIDRAREVGVLPSPGPERQGQATLRLWKSVTEVDLGRLDEAAADLEQATAELTSHPQLGPLCGAVRVRLLAFRGDRDEAVRRAAALLRLLDTSTLRPSIEWGCLAPLGQGLLEASELELARYCWERFLSSSHPPVTEPAGHYYLGECLRHLGDPSGALEEFRRATGPGIDSHHARLAEQRLRELGPDLAGSS
jgi:tetratricopeptide (TPR) repeat protein